MIGTYIIQLPDSSFLILPSLFSQQYYHKESFENNTTSFKKLKKGYCHDSNQSVVLTRICTIEFHLIRISSDQWFLITLTVLILIFGGIDMQILPTLFTSDLGH